MQHSLALSLSVFLCVCLSLSRCLSVSLISVSISFLSSISVSFCLRFLSPSQSPHPRVLLTFSLCRNLALQLSKVRCTLNLSVDAAQSPDRAVFGALEIDCGAEWWPTCDLEGEGTIVRGESRGLEDRLGQLRGSTAVAVLHRSKQLGSQLLLELFCGPLVPAVRLWLLSVPGFPVHLPLLNPVLGWY